MQIKAEEKVKNGTAQEIAPLELQEAWSHIPLSVPQTLKNGTALTILSRGIWNFEAGPDFRKVKLILNGKIRFGDVEIHRRTSDWIGHGHSGNPDYDNVILHVVGTDDSSAANVPFLPDIPVYVLPDSDSSKFREMPLFFPENSGKCSATFSTFTPEALIRFLEDAGLERLREKSDGYLQEMIQLGAPATLMLHLFDLMGVKHNRLCFQSLAQRVLAYSEADRIRAFSAILWGESGLLPDPAAKALPEESAETVKALWEVWWQLRKDAGVPLPWRRDSRPLNSLERRIALLAAFFEEFQGNPLPHFVRLIHSAAIAGKWEVFAERVSIQNEFWARHTAFHTRPLKNPAVLLSENRLIEITVNVILPLLCAYAKLNRDPRLEQETEMFFKLIPAPESNSILKNVNRRCFHARSSFFRTAAVVQGALHLYKRYCEGCAHDCSACLFQRSLTNIS